jgi:hypothetical protein
MRQRTACTSQSGSRTGLHARLDRVDVITSIHTNRRDRGCGLQEPGCSWLGFDPPGCQPIAGFQALSGSDPFRSIGDSSLIWIALGLPDRIWTKVNSIVPWRRRPAGPTHQV